MLEEFKNAGFKIIRFALPIYSGTFIVSVIGFVNMMLLSKHDQHILYLLSAFMPCYFCMLAFQETWRSVTIGIVTRFKKTSYLMSLIVMIILSAFISSFILYSGFLLFKGDICKLLSIGYGLQLNFIALTQQLLIGHIFSVTVAILNSVVLSLGYPILSAGFNILLSLSIFLLTQLDLLSNINVLHQYAYHYTWIHILFTFILIFFVFSKVFKNSDSNSLAPKSIQCFKIICAQIKNIGLPVFLLWFVLLFGVYIFNHLLAQCSLTVMKGYNLVYRLQMLVYQPALALGIATAILVQRHVSNDLLQSAWHIIKTGIQLSSLIYFFIGMILFLFRHPIALSLTTDLSVQHVVQECLSYTAIGWCVSGPVVTWLTLLEQTGYAILATCFQAFYFISLQYATKLFVVPTQNTLLFYRLLLISSIFSFIVFSAFPLLKRKILFSNQ
ncbi:MAG: MATE family efflux transporter [Gammaproteobacteria bacterium]|nr:MATE family efflux transporter [Gammaproteobacteria bacterium]